MTIQADLAAFADRDVVIYGSHVRGDATERSDVDVAIVSHSWGRQENMRLWKESLGKAPDRYDIHVYELLPMHIRADIAKTHEVLFGDAAAIEERFCSVRRRWQDVRHRYERPLPVRERLARRAEARI